MVDGRVKQVTPIPKERVLRLHDHPLAVVSSRAGIEAQMSCQSNAHLRISSVEG